MIQILYFYNLSSKIFMTIFTKKMFFLFFLPTLMLTKAIYSMGSPNKNFKFIKIIMKRNNQKKMNNKSLTAIETPCQAIIVYQKNNFLADIITQINKEINRQPANTYNTLYGFLLTNDCRGYIICEYPINKTDR